MSTGNHDSIVRRQFAASAERYRTSSSHARGPSLARLLELTAPAPDWMVLDVATGAGHVAAALAPHAGMVVAGDLTREMLDQAALLRRERGLDNIRFILESAQALAHPDGTFNLVTCRVAAHHFPSPDRFVSESARVLKPDGILALVDNVVPEYPGLADWLNDFERRRDPSHVRCLGVEQWQQLFARSGLELVHRETNPKRFDFREWMSRMNVDPVLIEDMGRELLAAPDAIRRFWKPATGDDGRLTLGLQEAILIARAIR